MSLVRFRLWAPFAGLAHLVERHLAKVEVASSSLVARSRVNQDIRFGCPDFFVRRKELDIDTHARSAIGSEVRQGSCELRSAIRRMPGSEFEPRRPLPKHHPKGGVFFADSVLTAVSGRHKITSQNHSAGGPPLHRQFPLFLEGFCVDITTWKSLWKLCKTQ